MKIAAQRGFWSLRPTLVARSVELGCWLAAGLLAVALVTSPGPSATLSVRTVRPIGVPHSPDLLAYRQHCIDRILASDLGMTEDYVVRQINQQCSTRRRIAARPVEATCSHPFVAQFAPMARRLTGCAGG